MACFDNYVNVFGHCDGATPRSGHYINKSLAGINLKKAANAAEGEIATGVALLEQSITIGIQQAREALVSEMLGVVNFNSIITSGEYGYFPKDFNDTTKYLDATAANRGLRFELSNNCKLSKIYVKSVQILLNTAVTGTLTITDGGTVTTKTFTATAKNTTEVFVDYKAQSETVLITLDNTSISVADSRVNYSGSCGFCSNDCCGNHSCGCTSGLNVYGWDGTNKNGTSYGLSATVHVICDEEKFFCEISNLPSVAWLSLYKSGIWFLEYLLQSGRLNTYTIYGKEGASLQIEKWSQEFDMTLKKLVKQLPRYLLSIDSCCIECNSSRWEITTP